MQLQLSLGVADQLHQALLVRGEPLDAVEAVQMLISSPNVPEALCGEILATLALQDRRFCWDAGQSNQLSLRHWEVPDPDLADVPFVALDLETTGARAGTSKITEIGVVRIEGFQVVKQFSTLVNPLRPIPPIITQITGITQEMVADAPRIEEVIPELLEFLDGAVVVAHNAQFDVGFLNYELQRLKGCRLGEGAIDTLPLARALAPGLPNYRLSTVAQALGAPVAACHRALADAQAAAHVFVTLVGRLQEQGITHLGEARAYVNPAARAALEKLRLVRDLPKTPGAYRFLDREGTVLYVGKADRLRERVSSHFVASSGRTRRMRRALRLVERVDWDETSTPLEAVVREQQLIVEHRPSCNQHGTRPETYAYVKVRGTGPGLSLFATTRAPKWLDDPDQTNRPARDYLVIGPFRKRSRVYAALDLLQRCYPIRRCPRRPDGRPCVRGLHGRCLAPCAGNPDVRLEHDFLVNEIIGWLTGRADVKLPDPLRRADQVIEAFSRQRRFEEAQNLQEACEHLISIRQSYGFLAEACRLCFAVLWPKAGNGDDHSARLNLVWNGRLCDPVSLYPRTVEEEVELALAPLWEEHGYTLEDNCASPVAVPQKELDSFLAVRRWFYETDRPVKIAMPRAGASSRDRKAFKTQLVTEAYRVLQVERPPSKRTGAAI